jgi:beta-xylosidase
MRPDEDFQPQNFLITCNDLTDPTSYSDPINFEFYGIDPSLLFDDDGKVYLQGSFIHGYSKKPATVIRQAEINIQTGELLSETRDIWQGSGHHVPEGPRKCQPHFFGLCTHLQVNNMAKLRGNIDIYKKDGIYWLLIAEGGTHRRHKVTMASSTHVWGPYEGYNQNPVLTGRDGSPVTCVGHAELVQDTAGEWWAFMLARREFEASYPIGRETFIVPVEWTAGSFPQFESAELSLSLPSRRVAAKANPRTQHQVALSSMHTIYLRNPELGKYKRGHDEQSLILQSGTYDLDSQGESPSFIGQRQTSLESKAQSEVDLVTCPDSGHIGLAVYKDPFRHASINIDLDRKEISLTVRHLGKSLDHTRIKAFQGAQAIELIVSSTVENYRFSYKNLKGSEWSEEFELGQVSCSDMSGDDFTGTTIRKSETLVISSKTTGLSKKS